MYMYVNASMYIHVLYWLMLSYTYAVHEGTINDSRKDSVWVQFWLH